MQPKFNIQHLAWTVPSQFDAKERSGGNAGFPTGWIADFLSGRAAEQCARRQVGKPARRSFWERRGLALVPFGTSRDVTQRDSSPKPKGARLVRYLRLAVKAVSWPLLINPRDRRPNRKQIFGGAERFSLAPAEGERAGVRGNLRPLTAPSRSRPFRFDP